MSNQNIYLHGIATNTPNYTYNQEEFKEMTLKLIGDTEEKRNFIEKIYKNSGIEKRNFTISKEYIENNLWPSTKKRNDIFIEEAKSLSLDCVKKLLDKLPGFDKSKISHIITVSCTGFVAPGIDFYITKELELNSAINRYNIGFMGCYAAFPALKLARNICLSEPEARVLMVTTELCTLHYQKIFEPDIVVANAIFADGITASLISSCAEDSKSDKILLRQFEAQYIDNSEEEMAWTIGESGFDLKLSVYVPSIIKENIQGILSPIFKRAHISKDDIDIWAIHPGGRAILDNISEALEIPKEGLCHSYDILREYGNMSSSSVMFILERVLSSEKYGKIFTAGFGPGLTVETGYLEKVG